MSKTVLRMCLGSIFQRIDITRRRFKTASIIRGFSGKMHWLFIGRPKLCFTITESRHFQIPTNISKHVLLEALL